MHVVAVGAHPDDIEIGAGGLVSKLVERGDVVSFIILTDEGDMKEPRRAEAVAAAAILGVPSDRVHFAGFADGFLRADRDTVGFVREIARLLPGSPDLVITHTPADSHNDHVEANRIAHATFRGASFLQFAVHISLEVARFTPRVFIELTKHRSKIKSAALKAHSTQWSRILKADLSEFEAETGANIGVHRAEAFEIESQAGARDSFGDALALSESTFHTLWLPILRDGQLHEFYKSFGGPGAAVDWPSGQESQGRDVLRESFIAHWWPSTPLIERTSGGESGIVAGTVLLLGSAVSNPIVRDHYNTLPGVNWIIGFDVPRTKTPYVLDRGSGIHYEPEFSSTGELLKEFAILAKRPNPDSPEHYLLCASGATGFGTRRVLEFLADPAIDPALATAFEASDSVEIAIEIDARSGAMTILDVNSPHLADSHA